MTASKRYMWNVNVTCLVIIQLMMWVQETLGQISFRVVHYWNTTHIISRHVPDLQKQLVPFV